MSYLGGSAVFWVQGNFIGTWLDRRERRHPSRERAIERSYRPSEQVLREIAQMDLEIASKLAARRSERTSSAQQPTKQFSRRPA